MEKRDAWRAGERGISPRALAATATNEAPGPGAERTPWVGSQAAAGARSSMGAANPRGRARLEELSLKCPLCGKLVRRSTLYEHAFAHFEKLEKMGVLRLSKEDGAWIIEIDGARFIGVGWRTLILVTEKLGAVANNSDRGVLLARQGENV